MIKKLAAALSVILFCGSPAMAAFVVPGLGEIRNIVVVTEGSARDPNQRDGFDIGGGQWLRAPTTLSSSTAAFLFASEGGFVGADQQMSAVWSSQDAGTLSIDFEALVIAPGDNLSAVNLVSITTNPESRFSRWKYDFRATEDSLLTFNIDTHNKYIGVDRDEFMFANNGTLTVKKYLPQRDIFIGSGGISNIINNTIKSKTLTYELQSGTNYILEYEPFFFSYGRDYPGTTLLQASQEISWSIGARPVQPPDPGAAVPEPATWAMMIIGFGVVGGALRRRRETEGASATLSDAGMSHLVVLKSNA